MNFAITGKKIVSSPQTILKKKVEQVKPIKKEVVKRSSIIAPKKQQKVQIKKQTAIKQPEIKAEIIEQKQQVELPLVSPPQLNKNQDKQIHSQILVRYNHYKDKFATINNILKYESIQQKYTFSSVFKGNYQPRLQIYRKYNQVIEPLTQGIAIDFTWKVQQGKQYQITIQEDQQQENKHQRTAYFAPKQQPKCSIKKNRNAEQITKELKAMSIEQFGTQRYKDLLEQRALEEDIFS